MWGLLLGVLREVLATVRAHFRVGVLFGVTVFARLTAGHAVWDAESDCAVAITFPLY